MGGRNIRHSQGFKMKIFALADCNNFYVSCERAFDPSIRNIPVTVLSNNDGCIIARSQEAKDVGIEMGAPAFKMDGLFKRHGVRVYSSNYALYGDMSHRVACTLSTFSPEMEVYSIDESFLCFDESDPAAMDKKGLEIRQKVLQWTGIPVSVGFGPTKTLAKVANGFAKKYTSTGVFTLIPGGATNRLLERIPVGDVWGIGRKSIQKLNRRGVSNARQLRDLSDIWLREQMTVTGLRTAMELRGIPCIPLEKAPPPKKAIVSSRSFGKPVSSLAELEESVACYITRAAEKLRRQNTLTCAVTVFLMTNPHKDLPQYSNSVCLPLKSPTDYTPELMSKAIAGLRGIYRKGFLFKKTGVMLTDIVQKENRQLSFEEFENPHKKNKTENLMALVDSANARFGRGTLKYASEGTGQGWSMRRNFKSPNYTTNWNELPVVS